MLVISKTLEKSMVELKVMFKSFYAWMVMYNSTITSLIFFRILGLVFFFCLIRGLVSSRVLGLCPSVLLMRLNYLSKHKKSKG